MPEFSEASRGDFWELLNSALKLQHDATCLAESGEHEQAATSERRAIALLLEATCLLDSDEPALVTVRSLAASGMARLHALNRRGRSAVARPRRKRVLAK